MGEPLSNSAPLRAAQFVRTADETTRSIAADRPMHASSSRLLPSMAALFPDVPGGACMPCLRDGRCRASVAQPLWLTSHHACIPFFSEQGYKGHFSAAVSAPCDACDYSLTLQRAARFSTPPAKPARPRAGTDTLLSPAGHYPVT